MAENTKNKSMWKRIVAIAVFVVIVTASILVGVFVFKKKDKYYNVFNEGLVAVKFDSGWGYMNEKGKTSIPGQFEDAEPFQENGLAKVKLDGHYGYINKKGKFVANPIYTALGDFNENLAVVKKVGQKYGYINDNGDEVIECQFDYASDFSYGLAPVRMGTKYGYINKEGSFEINPVYEGAGQFNKKGMAIVERKIQTDDFLTVVDKDGKERLTCKYTDIVIDDSGYIIAFDGTNYELYNKKFKLILKTDKMKLTNFNNNLKEFGSIEEGLIPFRELETNRFGYINKKGEIAIKANYDYVGDFNDGLAVVLKDGKYGYINKKGEMVIKNVYASAQPFNDGHAVVSNGHFKGLVNKKGKLVIDYVYTSLGMYSNGLCYFEKDATAKFGYVNNKNEVVVQAEYGIISQDLVAYNFSDDGYAVVKFGTLYGVINKKGDMVINPHLNDIKVFV